MYADDANNAKADNNNNNELKFIFSIKNNGLVNPPPQSFNFNLKKTNDMLAHITEIGNWPRVKWKKPNV
ncbi:hypothetical protein CBW54_22215 [Yersinia kristensenii]|nr:hypothetical protein CBW54_22215 [Yersinia kristensenii]